MLLYVSLLKLSLPVFKVFSTVARRARVRAAFWPAAERVGATVRLIGVVSLPRFTCLLRTGLLG